MDEEKNEIEKEEEQELEDDLEELEEDNYIDEVEIDDSYYSSAENQYFNEMRKYKLLTQDEEKELFQKLKNGDLDARKELIERNLPLVVSIAKRYRGLGMPFLDVIDEGNIGLIRAVDNYDLTKEIKFSTYATTAIKRQIFRELSKKGDVITIPVHMYAKKSKYNLAIKTLTYKLGRTPNDEELIEYLGITKQELYELRRISSTYVSLDAKLTEDDDATFGDYIATSDSSFDDDYIENEKRKLVRETLYTSKLTRREIAVLELRFGILDDRCRTLDEIGQMFKITRERVRQIEAKALRTLRNKEKTTKGHKLKEYL